MSDIENQIIKLLNDHGIQMLINSVHISEYKPDFAMEAAHSHGSIEINYIKSGTCYMWIGDLCLQFQENDCMIIYPGVTHYFYLNKRSGCTLLQLDFEIGQLEKYYSMIDISEQNNDSLLFLTNVIKNSYQLNKLHGGKTLESCITRIIDEKNNSDSDSFLIKLYFLELFVILSRQIKNSLVDDNDYSDKIKFVFRYINDNYNTAISVESVADYCNISSRYLRKIFKKETGINVSKYIRILRINKAKELIKDSSLNFTEIAMRTGFTTSQYFSRVFKKEVGVTPSEYKFSS